jgi:hypothetical protein
MISEYRIEFFGKSFNLEPGTGNLEPVFLPLLLDFMPFPGI